jgi:hypothetical protein
MNEKDNSSSSDLQTNVTVITSLTIFIIIVTGILFVSSLILSQNHTNTTNLLGAKKGLLFSTCTQ